MRERSDLTVILAAGKSTRIPELSFDRPKTLISVGGQTLLTRLLAQFAPVSDRFVIVAGRNAAAIRAHLAEISSTGPGITVIDDPDLTEAGNGASLHAALQQLGDRNTGCHILESDIVLTDTAVQRYLDAPAALRTLIIPVRSTSDDRLFIRRDGRGIGIAKQPPTDVEILGKLLGVTHLDAGTARRLHEAMSPDASGPYTDHLARIMSAPALRAIEAAADEAAEIDTADDYRRVLMETALARSIPSARSMIPAPSGLRLDGPLKRLIGVHDSIGARLAQRNGFDGLWLGSFQIALAAGGRDDASYDPQHALDLAEHLRTCGIAMPMVVDIGNGVDDSVAFVERAVRAGVAAICVEDNSAERVCSLYDDTNRRLIDAEEFGARIAGLVSIAQGRLQIIARTEALTIGLSAAEAAKRLRIAADQGADALLPHYVGKELRTIKSFLRNHPLPRPVLLVPTGLLQLPARDFKDMGCAAIVYANVDLRLRFHRLQEAYARLAAEAALGDDLRDSLADPVTMKDILEN
ncbi:MAG: isocitrate lyase/phosphoenolpyruvate mutase family protein [Chromatiales bacterium]|nr:isocitrate lyase/phosphoenolpyruvate mutase family protein [Chromatiales bacterium]